MSDEFKLMQDSSEGRAAVRVIEDETIGKAFDALQAQYLDAWRNTYVDDVGGRERLFLAVNLLDKVRDHLTLTIVNGRLADAELKQIAETAERAKARNRS